MLKGVDINEILEYSVKSDTGDNPTKFLIRNLKLSDKLGLFSGAMDKDGALDISKLQDKALPILLSGLKGIKNLNGKDYEPVTEDVIQMLSRDLITITEVLGKILEYNFMSEGEAKN